LGHVHQREILQDDPPVVFPGNLQGRNIRECGPKGAMLVTADETHRCQIEFRPLDVVRWLRLDIDISPDHSPDDVMDRFCRQLETAWAENSGMPLLVRTVIRGKSEVHAELAADMERFIGELRAAALEVAGGQVWVEKVLLESQPPLQAADLKRADGAIGELARLFVELADDPQRLCDLCPELTDLSKRLPREIKDGGDPIDPKDPKWLAGLLNQIQPMLLTRLMARRPGQ